MIYAHVRILIGAALAISEVRKNGAKAVETLKAKATEAQARGEKTATRQRESQSAIINLVPMVRKLLKDVSPADLENPDNEWISVAREKLLAIARQVNS